MLKLRIVTSDIISMWYKLTIQESLKSPTIIINMVLFLRFGVGRGVFNHCHYYFIIMYFFLYDDCKILHLSLALESIDR